MSNFRHYLNVISQGSEFFTLEKKFNFALVVMSVFHVILCITMFISGVIPLCIYNAFSAFVFAIPFRATVKRGNYALTLILAICEVAFCSFFSTLIIGFDCGFSLYNISMIAGVFYCTFVIDTFKRKQTVPVTVTLILVACFLFNYIMSILIAPLRTFPEDYWYHFFYITNALISFIMIIIFNVLLLWELKLSNDRLSTQNEQLDEMAHRDPLTHLYNRRSMNHFLDISMDALKRKGKRFSLILGDIDDFKVVNDTYGHDAGDLVLTHVSQIISGSLRDNDYVCRWGGEEILILINDPVETAIMAAERIRKSIENTTVVSDNQQIKITMTFGISESIPGFKIESLIQQADEKLYEGKKSGKNCVVS